MQERHKRTARVTALNGYIYDGCTSDDQPLVGEMDSSQSNKKERNVYEDS